MVQRAGGSNSIGRYVDAAALLFVFVTAFIGHPGKPAYLGISIAVLALLCVRNLPAVLVAMCIGGDAFLSLLASTFGISATLVIVGALAAEVVLLVSMKGSERSTSIIERRFEWYYWWIAALLLVVLINVFTCPKTEYTVYYIAYLLIYGAFACLSGLLVIRVDLRLAHILVPVAVLFVSMFPMFGFSVLNVPSEIASSAIGLRGREGLGPIALGRLAGVCVVLGVLVCWESGSTVRRRLLLLQVLVTLAAALPVLWYTQTRQAMIAVPVIVVFHNLVLSMRAQARPVRERAAALLVAVAVLVSAYMFLGWSADNLPQTRLHASLSGSARSYQYQDAWSGIKESPIYGQGMASYYLRYGMWPHNWTLEAWHDYGALGLVVLCGPMVLLLARAFAPSIGVYSWLWLGVYWVIVAHASGDIARNAAVFLVITIAFLCEPGGEKVRSSGPSLNP